MEKIHGVFHPRAARQSVYVLTMINGDKGNVMDDAWLDELTVHLDAIEADPAANRAWCWRPITKSLEQWH